MNLDRIEREIVIAAPLERVWSLVSAPGWWIPAPEGGSQPQVDVVAPGTRVVPVGPGSGEPIPVVVERIDPPHSISYRWASAFPGEEPADGTATRIEFTLAQAPEGTRLRVTESGFASLNATDALRRQELDGNTNGWENQLKLLRDHAERPAG